MSQLQLNGTDCLTKVKIFHQNIRSIRQNFDNFLISLTNFDKRPEIIVLSEIWINSNEVQFYEINNYTLKSKCNDEYRAGGVAIYVSNSIDIVDTSNVQIITADVLQIEIKILNQFFHIFAIYRTHYYTKEYFVNELENYFAINNNLKHLKNVLFIGDVNMNLLEQSNIVDNYKIVMAANGLKCLIEVPTRITDQSQTCIDHVYVKISDCSRMSVEAEVIDSDITDHCMLNVSLSVCGGKREATCPTTSYQIDYNSLSGHLDKVDWTLVYSQNNASVAYDVFINILKDCLEKSKKEIRYNNNYKKIKPWINNYICMKINIRNKIFKNLRKHPNNMNLKEYYTRYRNKLQNEIRNLKISYYKKKFDNCDNNSKKIWSVINEITCQGNNKDTSISLEFNGNIEINPQSVANIFNEYFINIVDKLNLNVNVPNVFKNLEFKNIFKNKSNLQSMFIDPVTKEELGDVIRSLKNGTAPGIDGVSSALVKYIYPVINNVLLYIVNLSFETGVFPSKLKNAVVIPIYKGGQKNICSNFRPISLLSTFSKVFEKIMKKKLLKYLNNIKFFSDNQFGYRDYLSTENALQHFMSDVYDGLNSGKFTTGLFLDIKKAFDTVDHSILLSKIHAIGIRGVAYDWFKSYLLKRNQCVQIQFYRSEMKCLNQGVPQGSVLGAILFLIYINEFCNGNFNGRLTAFADDTALCYTENNLNALEYKLNNDLMAIQWWFTVNNMLLNVDKTKYINFSLRKEFIFNDKIMYKCINCITHGTSCAIYCKDVGNVSQIKYLGLVLDKNVNWKPHIFKLKSKLNSTIRYFHFLKDMCDVNILKMLYFSLIQSRIAYGIAFWCGTYVSNTNVIHIQQKYILRLILKKPKQEPSRPLFKLLNIMPLKCLFLFKVIKLFYDKSKNYSQQNNMYKNRLRKKDLTFLVPKPSYTFFTKTYNFIAPRTFNKIPDCIIKSKTKSIFMKKLKLWLFSLDDIDGLLKIDS